ILKRTYESGDKHDTYYVYDTYGNLTYVIPPKVAGAISEEVLNGLCYQYKYDDRNRLVEKKLPGKQWEFIVYDKLDRPVATGPAFSPFKDESAQGWLITKYDAFSRPVYTGWYDQSSNAVIRKSLQDTQNAAKTLFEKKETSGTIDQIAVNYSNANAPTNFKLLTVTYYDTYDYPDAPVIPTTIEGQPVLANTKGMTTGNWTRVATTALATIGETTTTVYDDIKGRPIRINLKNHLGGYTLTDSKLDFSGKALYTITRHKRTLGDNELVVREDFTYTPQDRLLSHTHQINGGIVQLLTSNNYDALGQLESKNVGDTGGNSRQ
ncbi:RHS repeat-associated core domain-containing protein, partial [Flavobacterium araucananum]